MVKKKGTVGSWAFILGVVIAVIVGLFGSLANSFVIGFLVVLGLIVGLLNITGGETNNFLLAAVALVIVSAFGKNVLGILSVFGNILDAIMALVVPATIIVSLKSVYGLAKN